MGKAGGKDLFSQALSEGQNGDVNCASCWQERVVAGDPTPGIPRKGLSGI